MYQKMLGVYHIIDVIMENFIIQMENRRNSNFIVEFMEIK